MLTHNIVAQQQPQHNHHLGHSVGEVHVAGDLVSVDVRHDDIEEGVHPGLVIGQTQLPESLVSEIIDVAVICDCLYTHVRTLVTELSGVSVICNCLHGHVKTLTGLSPLHCHFIPPGHLSIQTNFQNYK